jgi:hypothetical protein
MGNLKCFGALSVLLVLIAGLSVACARSASQPSGGLSDANGQALLEERCTACHSVDRVTGAKMTRAEWEHTVGHMVEHGASLSTSEQSALIDYLAKTYGG